MYPFHTLFNITKARGGIPDEDEEPKGVDPPCVIHGKVTVDRSYHQNWKLLARPPGSISQPEGSNSRMFNFKLSAKEGALLMLPKGGVLKRLQKTSVFKRRILDFWRDWYEFAEEEGDLDETQTLCLLTGVEQCRTWAMAVWDSVSGGSANPESLALAADEPNDTYTWAPPPPRCSTQSLTLAPTPAETGDQPELKETVFIHAFWISRSSGTFTTHPTPVPGQDREGNGNHDEDSSRRRRSSRDQFDPSQGPRGRSQNPFRVNRSHDGSSSNNDSPGQAEGWNTSGAEYSDKGLTNTLSIVSLSDSFNMVSHPCQFINQLALKLASRVQPSLLDSGCVAISHDEDWINVLADFNEPELPKGKDFLKLICEKFKFVAEGDAIYTEHMTPAELDLRQQSLAFAHEEAGLIPVVFHLREPDIPHRCSQASSEETSPCLSDESNRGSLDGSYRSKNHASNHDERDFIPRPSFPAFPMDLESPILLSVPAPIRKLVPNGLSLMSTPYVASSSRLLPTPRLLPSFASTLNSSSFNHQVVNLPQTRTRSSVSDSRRIDTLSAQLRQHHSASSDTSPSQTAGKKRARTDSPDAYKGLDLGQSSTRWKQDMDQPSLLSILTRINDPKDYANTRAPSVLPPYSALPSPKKRRVNLSGVAAVDTNLRASPDQSIFTPIPPVAIDSRASQHDVPSEVEQTWTTTPVKQEQRRSSVAELLTPAIGTLSSTNTPTTSSTGSWRRRSYGAIASPPKAISPIALPRRAIQHEGKKEELVDHVPSIASTSHSLSIPMGNISPTPNALHNPRYKDEKPTLFSPFETFYDAFTDSKQLKTQLSDRSHWSDAPVSSHTQQHEKLSEMADPWIEKEFGSMWSEEPSPQHHGYTTGKSAFLTPPETFYDALIDSQPLITQLSDQLHWSATLVRSHDQMQEKLSEVVDALLEEKVGIMRSEVLSLRHRMEELEYALHGENPRLYPITEEAHGQS
ncbi:hypothetical protein AAF712_016602 [Marasmius tenuissimus]|uniref:Uncharacterized protein n=1 Tax=Marasmius tenuissimus TaxID=585030 RepID=A0ABR2Z5K6_9AGAR